MPDTELVCPSLLQRPYSDEDKDITTRWRETSPSGDGRNEQHTRLSVHFWTPPPSATPHPPCPQFPPTQPILSSCTTWPLLGVEPGCTCAPWGPCHPADPQPGPLPCPEDAVLKSPPGPAHLTPNFLLTRGLTGLPFSLLSATHSGRGAEEKSKKTGQATFL